MSRQHLHVAELGEAPLLARGGLAGRGVDEVVHMVALDDGDAQRQRPGLVEAVGQRRDDIEVLRVPLDGLFVGDLARVDIARALAQARLVHRLDSQVGAPADMRLAGALRVAVGHQRAERRAA